MAPDIHIDLKLALVCLGCLALAWGLVFAAIGVGIGTGLSAAKRDRAPADEKRRSS